MWTCTTKVIVSNFNQAVPDSIKEHTDHAMNSQLSLDVSFVCFNRVLADTKLVGSFPRRTIIYQHDKDFPLTLSEETQSFMLTVVALF